VGRYATVHVTGNSIVGGLVGGTLSRVSSGSITSSYATGQVTASDTAGGLFGGAAVAAPITNSYAAGRVSTTPNREVGGLIALAPNDGVSNSYWDIQSSGQASSEGGLKV